MMGITRSLNVGLFTGKFTQTTTSTYKAQLSATFMPSFSTAQVLNSDLLFRALYTLYTGLITITVYLNKRNT
jgi:hypothetical protein